MDIYEELGVKKLINASETYTVLGGSLMSEQTWKAMRQAGSFFVDYNLLLDRVCEKAARLTNNESAFVTSGASAGLILCAGASMVSSGTRVFSDQNRRKEEELLLEEFPDTEKYNKNEILIFRGEFRDAVPYWKLLRLTGARIIDVEPSLQGIKEAVTEKTAAFVLFPAPLYEKGILSCEEAIPVIKSFGIDVIVDASAQLPPPSNLWYYTRALGADACVFSGGKHIRGPQSTGLIVGKKRLTDICRKLASPNERLGRGFKTGKEELAGFIAALDSFVTADHEAMFESQRRMLEKIRTIMERAGWFKHELVEEGRLGTYQPLLHVWLPENKTAEDCKQYMRSLEEGIDIGTYTPEFHMPENLIFVNAYNLKNMDEADKVGNAIVGFLCYKDNAEPYRTGTISSQ